jgi:hypothetical protein
LISLHNYFIIYDIKYFFLNKINQTIQGGAKKFSEGGGKLPKVLPKSTVFQNPGGAAAPPGTLCIRPGKGIRDFLMEYLLKGGICVIW